MGEAKGAGRTRSFWAWGFEDAFPNEEARVMLRDRLTPILGHEPAIAKLPRIEDAKLPKPRVTAPETIATISHADDRARVMHTYGRGYADLVRAFALDFSHAPDFVIAPANEEDVARAMEACAKEKIALVPFGGGTSVVSGTTWQGEGNFRGWASLDLGKLDAMLEIDATSRAARFQAGATGPAIEDALRPHGMTLRHFPQSFELSTLGGWIATRAGGHFATLYTHIDDLVESVRMVTPSGIFATRRLPASGAGPSPDRLVLGSEGILGVITEAWVRVVPRPRWRAQASVRFDDFEKAVRATRMIAQSGLHPSNCRLLDPMEAAMHRVSFDGSSVLVLAFESADHPLEPWMERALSIAEDAGGTAGEATYRADGDRTESIAPGDTQAWRRAFLDGPYLQSALVTMGVVVDTFETACAWSAFPSLHKAVTDSVTRALQENCGGGVLSCRFTHVYADGPAPYYTFLGAGKPGQEIAQWTAIKNAASRALVENGATITHHHAVGRTHRPHYEQERPELFARALSATKNALDPSGILNPGVLVVPPHTERG